MAARWIILVGLLGACEGSDRALIVDFIEVEGSVRLFGRAQHEGIQISVSPGGDTLEVSPQGDFSGRVPEAGTLSFSAPGFATLDLEAHALTAPLSLFRGERVLLPELFVPARADAVPPSSLVLWSEQGEGVLVDLAEGALRAGLRGGNITEIDGWVVDFAEGDIEALTVDGEAHASHRGEWSRVGTLRSGAEEALLLSRPWPNKAGQLQLSLWSPLAGPKVYAQPVREIGPIIEAGGRSEVALLTGGSVLWWGLDGVHEAVDFGAEEVEGSAFVLGEGALHVCFTVGGPYRVECIFGDKRRTVARPDPEAPLALVGGSLVVWQTPEGCRAALTPQDHFGPYPCEGPEMAGWPGADKGVFLLDAEGALRRLARGEESLLGEASQAAGGELGVAFVDGGRATLAMHDGVLKRGGEGLGEEARIWTMAEGALFLDPGGSLVWLAAEGPRIERSVDPEIAAIGLAATQHFSNDRHVVLSGRKGVLRLDRGAREVISVPHPGARWEDFGVPEQGLPSMAVTRVREGFYAVDLWTGARDPLGEGRLVGLVGGYAWYAGVGELYVVADPGAQPITLE